MHATATVARLTGVLFVLATALGILSVVTMGDALGAADYLAALAANPTGARVAALLDVLMVAAIVAIPVVLYPVMHAVSPTLAVAYVVARLAEGLLIVVGAIALITAVDLSAAFTAAGSPANSPFQILGDTLNAGGQTAFNLGALGFFGASAVVLNWVLYRARLVPAWISLWGLIGGALVVTLGLLIILNVRTDLLEAILTIPIAVNEMVLAVWLIVRGFSATSTSKAA